MATAVSKKTPDFVFEWEGKDRNGKQVRGETPWSLLQKRPPALGSGRQSKGSP